MPKKSRRTKSKHRDKLVKSAQIKHSHQNGSASTNPQLLPNILPSAKDTITRYQHVITEVKYIGILAGPMILILIVLSFILG